MDIEDWEKYCNYALEKGATTVKIIHPGTVVTAPWVRLKCQFGCGGYGNSYCCPPHSPQAQETRKVLDSYHRAILFHVEISLTPNREKNLKKYHLSLVELEGIIFKDGYYKAFVFLAGPCDLCGECSVFAEAPCKNRYKARPSMEACGIDVFQTARNNGFHIKTLRDKTEPKNFFSLMLVD